MTHFALTVFALLVGQSLFLGAMVWDRVSLLRSDTVVTLETRPIDPRDLFRGHYVILNYTISTITLDEIDGDDDFAHGDTIYVELARQEPVAQPVAVWREHREVDPGHALIRGRVSFIRTMPEDLMVPEDTGRGPLAECPGCNVVSVDYGIESYFVPEGEGRELEHSRNEGRITVDVALDGNGTAAIKQLRLDGEPVYEEPLF